MLVLTAVAVRVATTAASASLGAFSHRRRRGRRGGGKGAISGPRVRFTEGRGRDVEAEGVEEERSGAGGGEGVCAQEIIVNGVVCTVKRRGGLVGRVAVGVNVASARRAENLDNAVNRLGQALEGVVGSNGGGSLVVAAFPSSSSSTCGGGPLISVPFGAVIGEVELKVVPNGQHVAAEANGWAPRGGVRSACDVATLIRR